MTAATVPSAMQPTDSAGGSTDGLAIALRGLRKSYGSHLALDGLDLSVPSGVVYGFLGPNGAGKTTTMRLLTGLIHPDAGSMELLGRPFERGDRRRLFDVGALIETPSFYPYLSGRENLRSLAASGASVRRSRIAELLELVGLAARAGDAVSTYSLGMKQRLGIASALLSDPTLLLLDEPANGLDPAGIVALRDTLKQLAGSGKTVFVSSHILGEVRELADVVGIISAGRLVREGPMQTLLQEGGAVRVRVMKAEVARARVVLAGLAGMEGVNAPPATGSDETDGPAWLSVQLPHERAAEVNRALAEAGIYASGLETESTLEALFLELTGGQATTGREGTFQGVSAARTGSGAEPGGSTGEGGA
jgi:ABC-2 type transport system ATP-binding protein